MLSETNRDLQGAGTRVDETGPAHDVQLMRVDAAAASVPAPIIGEFDRAMGDNMDTAAVPPGARPRAQTEDREVVRAGALLTSSYEIGTRIRREQKLRREVRRFYAPGVVGEVPGRGPLAHYLEEVATNGGRLFLRGACLGVGASTLVQDFAAAYNLNARAHGIPEIGYVDITTGCSTVPRMIEAIAYGVGLRLRLTDLRLRHSGSLLDDLMGFLLMRGIGTLVLDHVGNATKEARDLIAALFRALTPTAATLRPSRAGGYGAARMGVVLVDHEDPTLLFQRHLSVLVGLTGDIITLDRYRTPDDMAVALAQADIGFDELDSAHPDTRLALECLLEATHGLPIYMERAFTHLDTLRARYPTHDLLTLARAIPLFMRPRVKLREDDGLSSGDRVVTLTSVTGRRGSSGGSTDGPEALGVSGTSEVVASTPRPRVRESRREKLQRKKKEKEATQRDHKDLLRKQHVSLPTSHG